jgi:hypothetical protein
MYVINCTGDVSSLCEELQIPSVEEERNCTVTNVFEKKRNRTDSKTNKNTHISRAHIGKAKGKECYCK